MDYWILVGLWSDKIPRRRTQVDQMVYIARHFGWHFTALQSRIVSVFTSHVCCGSEAAGEQHLGSVLIMNPLLSSHVPIEFI